MKGRSWIDARCTYSELFRIWYSCKAVVEEVDNLKSFYRAYFDFCWAKKGYSSGAGEAQYLFGVEGADQCSTDVEQW